MVWIHKPSNVLLRTSFDPAYKISITALASEIATTKNRRAAGLLQDYMAETVRIPASRGALFFYSIEEGNLIASGLSDQGNMGKNELDAEGLASSALNVGAISKSRRSRKSSVVTPTMTPDDTKSHCQGKSHLNKLDGSRSESKSMLGTESKKVKKRKSLMALLGF